MTVHSKAQLALARQEKDMAREKQWWATQKAKVESGDLIGYYTSYIASLEERIKEVGGFSSEYRETCLSAMKATLKILQTKG